MGIRQALIPAAGRGARLDRPETPKPLVDVGGQPLVLRLLSQLEGVGVERAVVVVGYGSQKVVRALTLHPRLRLQVDFVQAPCWQEGLAASVLAARERLDGPFLLAMADHVFDDGLVRRMSDVAPADGQVVALVDEATDRVFDLPAAVKVTFEGDRLTGIGRDLERFDAVDAGLFAADSALFDALAHARKGDAAAELLHGVRALVEVDRARVVRAGGLSWDDVDTPAGLVRAEMRLRREHRVAVARAPTPAPRLDVPRYRFTTGAAVDTEVVVGRGLLARGVNLDFIPPDSATSPIFLFTDAKVDGLYGVRIVEDLRERGHDVQRIVMPDGEEAKTLASYARLVEEVLGRGIDERSLLVSLGGGAVCNVCGFVASTLYRGIGLLHVPTTLLAQVDAAISHKQAINGSRGKNLVGSFYPPAKVVVDVDFLETLEDWLIPDGLAECIKHALGQHPTFLERFLGYEGDIRDLEFLESVVRKNIELKCAIMAGDPQEHAEGMVLLYGHEIGHAVEYLSGYELGHGQAISVGMAASARVSRILGGCDDRLVEIHDRVLSQYGLPTRVPAGIRIPDILDAMRYDKRYLREGIRMALLADVGRLWNVDGDYAIPVSETVLVEALEAVWEGGKR